MFDACNNLRAALLQKAGLNAPDAVFADGSIDSSGHRVSLAGLVGPEGLTTEGAADPGDSRKQFTQESYGAHFA